MAHLLSSIPTPHPLLPTKTVLSSSSGDDAAGEAPAEPRAYSWGRKTVVRAGRGQSWEKPARGDEASVDGPKLRPTRRTSLRCKRRRSRSAAFPDGVRKGIETMKAGERAQAAQTTSSNSSASARCARSPAVASSRRRLRRRAAAAVGGCAHAPRSPTAACASPSARLDRPSRRQGGAAARPRGGGARDAPGRARARENRRRDGFGAAGDAALGVPPGAALVAEVTLLRWRRVVAPPPERARRHRRRRRAAGRSAARLSNRERARPHASVGAGAVRDGRRARGVRAGGGGQLWPIRSRIPTRSTERAGGRWVEVWPSRASSVR